MKIKTLVILVGVLMTGNAFGKIDKFAYVDNGIYRGAQPDQEGYDELKQIGIKTVMNFRTTEIDEDKAMAEKAGLEYISHPIFGLFGPTEMQFRKIMEQITDPSNLPIFIHCREGKDRTGLIVGLYRVKFENWEPKKAYAEMRSYGFNPWLFGMEIFYWVHSGWLGSN